MHDDDEPEDDEPEDDDEDEQGEHLLAALDNVEDASHNLRKAMGLPRGAYPEPETTLEWRVFKDPHLCPHCRGARLRETVVEADELAADGLEADEIGLTTRCVDCGMAWRSTFRLAQVEAITIRADEACRAADRAKEAGREGTGLKAWDVAWTMRVKAEGQDALDGAFEIMARDRNEARELAVRHAREYLRTHPNAADVEITVRDADPFGPDPTLN